MMRAEKDLLAPVRIMDRKQESLVEEEKSKRNIREKERGRCDGSMLKKVLNELR